MKLKRTSSRDSKSYRPSAREIRRACVNIRSKWSEQEIRKRAGMPDPEPWTPPRATIDFLEEEERRSWF